MSMKSGSSSFLNSIFSRIIKYKKWFLFSIIVSTGSIISHNIFFNNKCHTMIYFTDMLYEIYDEKTPVTRKQQLFKILENDNIITYYDNAKYLYNYIQGNDDFYKRNTNILKECVNIYVNGVNIKRLEQIDYYNEGYSSNRFSINGQLLLLLKAKIYYDYQEYKKCADLSFSHHYRTMSVLPYHILRALSLAKLEPNNKSYASYYILNMVGYSRDSMTKYCHWTDIIKLLYNNNDKKNIKQQNELEGLLSTWGNNEKKSS